MKKWLYVLLLISLVGCQTVEAIPTKTMVASSITPALISIPTNSPSETPALSLTIAPSPTPKACPSRNANVTYKSPETPVYHDVHVRSIEDFLNAGGDPEQLSIYFNAKVKDYFQVNFIDLNADATPDLLVREGDDSKLLLLFSCINGVYQEQLGQKELSDQLEIMGIDDFNKNGIPEIVYKEIGCFFSRCGFLSVIEWDGEKFSSTLKDKGLTGRQVVVDSVSMSEPQDSHLEDLDGDGIPELIWTGEVPPDWHGDHWAFYPQRLATHVFKWDGVNYTAQQVEYSAPMYRFQAVQDGDLYAKAGLYDKALQFYQLAIESNNLDWWTEERYNYIVGPHGLGPCAEKSSTCPLPAEDPNERPILSAYASFRTVLVHLLMNDSMKAETVYQDILKTYSPESRGYPIVEMTTKFWNEYQTTQGFAKACAQSLTYIKARQDVLSILTGGANVQGIYYKNKPQEVCPFK